MNVSPAPPALRNIVPPGYRLRLPGPAAVPERVRAAIAQLSGRVIRFGTMGWVDDADILTDLQHLECTLRDLGEAPPAGAGIAAASRVLAA